MQYYCKINQNCRCRVVSVQSSSSPLQPKIASYAPVTLPYKVVKIPGDFSTITHKLATER